MDPFRIRVAPLGKGYMAEAHEPLVTAMGASAEEAAENARLMAMDLMKAFASRSYPSTLIVRIDEPGRSAIAMQSMDKPFSLEGVGKEPGSCYFDSAGNDAAPSGR